MREKPKIHIGIYGIYLKDKTILMIKKNRGPYTGKLDLPGGSIEFGESLENALRREISEETGSKIQKMNFLSNEDYTCQYIKEGVLKDFHHIGIYYSVDLDTDALLTTPDGHDSDGAIFVPIHEITVNNTSPIAYKAIRRFFIHIQNTQRKKASRSEAFKLLQDTRKFFLDN